MKKIAIIMFALVAFATTVFAAVNDSVKGFSGKEYTIISGTDTTTVLAGDSMTSVTFSPADKLIATGKTTYQMINGQKTKIKQVSSHGKKFWIKDDVNLDCGKCNDITITMWCDENETSDAIPPMWYGLIGLVVVAGGLALWKNFRG